MVSPPEPSSLLTTESVLQIAFPGLGQGTPGALAEVPVYLIPQASQPRWMILGDPRLAAPVLRSWRPFKASTRLLWSGVVAASSLGLLSRLPGVISTRAHVDLSYWRKNLPGFSSDWLPVVHVGNPSHSRKAIVFFVGPDRQFKAVAKIPLVPGGTQAILNEFDIFHALRESAYLPKPLFRDPARGIAAQSWLEGAPVSRTLTPAHMDLLARFALPGVTVRVVDFRAEITAGLDRTDLPFDRSVLTRALEMLDNDRPLPAFLEHRDFAPWNLKRLSGGESGAIDWEWAVLRSLPCQDIFRYFAIQDALFYGPGTVWHTCTTHPLVQAHFRRFAIPPEVLPPLAMYYFLRVLLMDWQGGNPALAHHSYGQIERLLEAQANANSQI